MISSSIFKALSLLSLGVSCLAGPVVKRGVLGAGIGGVNAFTGLSSLSSVNSLSGINGINSNVFSPISFNNFGDLQSLNNFDSFFGVNNFNGQFNNQVFVNQEQILACQQVDALVLQQQLAVIQEFAKGLLLQQACDVELQVLALQQFVSGFDAFSQDLRRVSGRNIGFDANIANLIGTLFDPNTFALSNQNLNFLGSDIGLNSFFVSGSNWVDATSPFSVGSIFDQSLITSNALLAISNRNSFKL